MKKLVPASEIALDKSVRIPSKGDVVLVEIEGYKCVALCSNLYSGGSSYYITNDGDMYPYRMVKVIKIIGKCVLSVYV